MLSAPVPIDTEWSVRLLTTCIVMPILATLATIGRFVARKMKRLEYGWDDWLMVVALFFYYSHTVVVICGTVYGGSGHSITTLAPSVLTDAGKLLLAVQIAYAIPLGLVKCSVCMMLIRIFGRNVAFRRIIYVVLGFAIAWTIMVTLTALLNCRPIALNWDKTIEGQCDNEVAVFVAVASVDIVVDTAVLVAPLPFIWKLHLPVHIRIALTMAFAVGVFDIAIGLVRIFVLDQIDFAGDWTDTLAPSYFWTYLEPGIAMIVADAVIMRPIIDKFIPSWMRSKSSQPYARFAEDNGTELHTKPLNSTLRNSLATKGGMAPSHILTTAEGNWHPQDAIMTSRTSADRGDIHVQRDIFVQREPETLHSMV